MFHGHILKFKSNKRSKKENKRKAQNRKARREENNFALISKVLSYGDIRVKKVNVADLNVSLKGTQVYWLKQMMERGLMSDQACKSTCPLSALQTVNQRTVILSNTE